MEIENGPILETQNIKISNKLIKPDDIRSLFSEISKEIKRLDILTKEKYDQALRSKEYKDVPPEYVKLNLRHLENNSYNTLNITAKDRSTYESKTFDILEYGNILDKKQIESLSYSYHNYTHAISISISLTHSNYDFNNKITITGGNSVWVNGFLRKIEDVISSWENQSTWTQKYSKLISLLLIGCFAYVFGQLFIYFIHFIDTPSEKTSPENSNKIVIAYILFYMVMGICALTPAFLLKQKINSLWKSVELQTGKEYHQVEKQRRQKIWLLLSIVIIPTVISIIIEILK